MSKHEGTINYQHLSKVGRLQDLGGTDTEDKGHHPNLSEETESPAKFCGTGRASQLQHQKDKDNIFFVT